MIDLKEKSLLKKDIEYSRLLGEFTGTLEAILFWNIPVKLQRKLESKIKELKSKQI